ncbi:MAG TPA: beta-ketoacyl synthase N-terminal-like domain-containing protein, partial [Conexibacter sp.]
MTSAPAIVVTGIGVRSPLGSDLDAFWRGALDGAVATRPLTRFDTARLSSDRGGELAATGADDVADGGPVPLAVRLAEEVVVDAVADARLTRDAVAPERAGVCIGTVMGTRPAVERWLADDDAVREEPREAAWADPALLSRAPARTLGLAGPNCVVATGCAAGNSALAWGAEALQDGRADAMVVGGADVISQAMLMMFDSFGLLAPDAVRPFDAEREGLLLGEGAAAFVLEREADARARGARIHGRVLGWSNVADAFHITSPHPEARGAVRAMRRALARADVEASAVDHVSAHGTGTPANDAVEARAIRDVLGGAADEAPVTALKSLLGHSQGAASALEAAACLLTIRDGLVPPVGNYATPDPAW